MRGQRENLVKSALVDTVGERIRYARTQAGLTQADLAKALKTSNGQVGDKESNRSKPSYSFLLALELISGCSADWLLTGEGEMRTDRSRSGSSSEIRRASRPMDLTPPSKAVTEILGKAWDVLEQDKAAAVAVTSVVEMAYAQLKSPERAAPESNAGEDTRSALKTG